jgi:hypothetical protein
VQGTWRSLSALLLSAIAIATSAAAVNHPNPIALHPENPHYFLWRGRPTILITSGEHYGAVLNRNFEYRRYLETLESNGFNLTRVFTGAYCEPRGAFGIGANTLAPAPGMLLCPWARSETPGYANGGNTFDLTRWDPAYFDRLTDFVTQAARRGIVVEVVLFCPFYEDHMWELSPMNARNNVNGIGRIERTEVYTLKHKDLMDVQEAMVRRIVTALRDFDNVYYEICNEPYFGGVTLEWQDQIAQTIAQTESAFEHKHLIAQNIANHTKKIENPNAHVSVFNFHYAKPPVAVGDNYHLNKVIGDDETGFAGEDRVKPYRLEGWDFIMAGGAVFNNLDYSFAVGHEDGTARIDAPGGGGPELWRQLRILSEFINRFDFVKMKPDNSVIAAGVPKGATARALVQPGRAYAIYVNGNGVRSLSVNLPSGSYETRWVDTKTGNTERAESFEHVGGSRTLDAPAYSDDIALRLTAVHKQRVGLLFESDFEGGDLAGWRRTSGNAPIVVGDPVRAGTYAMKTSLDREKDGVSYRTEVSGPHAEIGKEYWYGLSIFLPEDYVPDGILQGWKGGKKVIDQPGPNTFNDKDGPFFKMGLYKGWSDPNRPSDRVSERFLYHDEFRMAGAQAGYNDVAPGP